MKFRFVFDLAAALGFVSLAASDLTITYTATSKGALAGAGNGTELHYYTPKFHLNRNEEAKRDSLVDFEKGISYSIDHKKKTIQMVKIDDALAALNGLNQSQPEGMAAMMGAMFGDPNDCKVEKLGSEKVAGRDCQIYAIKVGKLLMTLSVDPTLKVPVAEGPYLRMMQSRAATFAKSGGPVGASFKRLFDEMAKIKGIQLKTHMTGFMGMNIATEATRIDASPVAEALFALPVGYKLEDLGKKMREEMKGK